MTITVASVSEKEKLGIRKALPQMCIWPIVADHIKYHAPTITDTISRKLWLLNVHICIQFKHILQCLYVCILLSKLRDFLLQNIRLSTLVGI